MDESTVRVIQLSRRMRASSKHLFHIDNPPSTVYPQRATHSGAATRRDTAALRSTLMHCTNCSTHLSQSSFTHESSGNGDKFKQHFALQKKLLTEVNDKLNTEASYRRGDRLA